VISRALLVGCLLAASVHGQAAETAAPEQDAGAIPAQVSLPGLYADADLVAVVQVKDTDYVYTREFPSEGSAFLKVLIPYKPADTEEDIIEVYEKGLHPHECYFENPTVFEEGRRYLGFFQHDPEDPESYRGLAKGCVLEVLVTADSSYALRLPLDGFELDADLEQYATQLDFRDAYAVLDEEVLTPVTRDDLLARGLIIPYQGNYKYTRGLDLATARRLFSTESTNPANNR